MGKFTIADAKSTFFKYSCSLFVMGRENPEMYKIYMNLKIDKETENLWRFEKLLLLYKSIEDETRTNNIGVIYNEMYDQVKCINSSASLDLMLNVIELTHRKLKDLDKLMIIETNLGKKDMKLRSGLLYQSFDKKDIKKTLRFAKYTKEMLEQISSKNEFLIRINEDKEKFRKILIDLSITNQQIDAVMLESNCIKHLSK